MNGILSGYYPIFREYQALRNELLDALSDQDLAFSPGGGNPTLGALCREIGETEQNYVESFRTFRHEYAHGGSDPALAGSVAALREWYAELDRGLEEAVSALSDEEIATRVVDRGGDFRLPPQLQLDVYKEALLIFYAKASVYLKARGAALPQRFREWIG